MFIFGIALEIINCKHKCEYIAIYVVIYSRGDILYTLNLPRNIDKTNINKLMVDIIDQNKNPLYTSINFDFTSLNFIRPAGVVTLDNIISWLSKRGVDVKVTYYENITNPKSAIKYLDDSGFFEKYLNKKLVESSSLRRTTIPLQNVTYESSASWLTFDFIPWLAQQLNVKISSLADIETCLGEIFNNIKDHSFENIGCLFAQHFPNEKRLIFCIADFGVGIPHNVRKVEPNLSDEEALTQAIVDGFTTKTSPRNLGAGLHTMLKNVAYNLKGSVHINSGYGILNAFYDNDKGEIGIETCSSTGYYPGTFLEFNINTEIVVEEDALNDEEEEFLW